MPIDPHTVCAVVLAGGRGTRMGGVDKGLQLFKGQALALHAVQRLQAQVPNAPGLIAINANRNLNAYAQWGHPVWPDATPDFAGPLAGFETALQHALAQPSPTAMPYAYVLVVPCDSPRFPLDVLQRLGAGLEDAKADIAMAAIVEMDETNPGGVPVLRAQPVFCLLRTTMLASLRNYMATGGRKIDTWVRQQAVVEVAFNSPQDKPGDFFNANTLEQLAQLAQGSGALGAAA